MRKRRSRNRPRARRRVDNVDRDYCCPDAAAARCGDQDAEDGRIYFPVTAADIGWLLFDLVPQGLAIGVAIGVPSGILWALRRRSLTSATRKTLVALAFASSLTGWFNVDRVVPASNRAFRALIGRSLARGPNELSLSELRSELEKNRDVHSASVAALQRSFHMRGVAALAPLVLGLFVIALHSAIRTPGLPTTIGVAVTIAYVAFYTAINPSRFWDPSGSVPPFVVAWTPNVALTLFTLLILVRSKHARPS